MFKWNYVNKEMNNMLICKQGKRYSSHARQAAVACTAALDSARTPLRITLLNIYMHYKLPAQHLHSFAYLRSRFWAYCYYQLDVKYFARHACYLKYSLNSYSERYSSCTKAISAAILRVVHCKENLKVPSLWPGSKQNQSSFSQL